MWEKAIALVLVRLRILFLKKMLAASVVKMRATHALLCLFITGRIIYYIYFSIWIVENVKNDTNLYVWVSILPIQGGMLLFYSGICINSFIYFIYYIVYYRNEHYKHTKKRLYAVQTTRFDFIIIIIVIIFFVSFKFLYILFYYSVCK